MNSDYEGIVFAEPMLSYEELLGEDFIFEDDELFFIKKQKQRNEKQGSENEQEK